MGQEAGFTTQKRIGPSAGTALPTTFFSGGARPRRRHIAKTFNNIKITILCGFVTILVLRGTIGLNLGTPQSDAEKQTLEEEARRVIAEIRSDGAEPDDGPPLSPNMTFTFGPRISGWDQERSQWVKSNLEYPSYVNE